MVPGLQRLEVLKADNNQLAELPSSLGTSTTMPVASWLCQPFANTLPTAARSVLRLAGGVVRERESTACTARRDRSAHPAAHARSAKEQVDTPSGNAASAGRTDVVGLP